MSLQFQVFRHPIAGMRKRYPHIIVLQHDQVTSTGNVVVAPLVTPLSLAATRIYPVLNLNDTKVMLLTPDLAVISRGDLKTPIANLSEQRARIIAAIDLLFVGS